MSPRVAGPSGRGSRSRGHLRRCELIELFEDLVIVTEWGLADVARADRAVAVDNEQTVAGLAVLHAPERAETVARLIEEEVESIRIHDPEELQCFRRIVNLHVGDGNDFEVAAVLPASIAHKRAQVLSAMCASNPTEEDQNNFSPVELSQL